MIATSLLSRLSHVPLVFLDVETTGASTTCGDRITEVAALRIENGQVVDAYAQLVNPCRPIWPGVIALTGITNEMVADEPRFVDIADTVAAKLSNAIIVGHNVCFDLGFMAAEFRRAKIQIDQLFEINKVLDTVRLARRVFGRSGNGLQKLAARLNIAVDTAHRALADCHTTAGVFREMLEPLGGGQMTLADAILLQGGPCGFNAAPPAIDLPLELQEALADGSHVKMIYLDARNARTERIVVPLSLGKSGPERCLTAFCTMRGDQRSFKLSRIVEVTRIEVDPA
jgi:DNA polymerase-3 subunit epsilon